MIALLLCIILPNGVVFAFFWFVCFDAYLVLFVPTCKVMLSFCRVSCFSCHVGSVEHDLSHDWIIFDVVYVFVCTVWIDVGGYVVSQVGGLQQ